jgi:VWFA-related protein
VLSAMGSRARVARLIMVVCFLASGTASAQQQDPQKQDIPDAPSATRPVPQFPDAPPAAKPEPPPPPNQAPPGEANNTQGDNPAPQPEATTTPPAFNVKTVPPGTAQEATGADDKIFKITVPVNDVLVPVRVTDQSGRLVSGLFSKDFSVYEDGQKQKLNFFTSDPFALSAAVIFDLGMPDVAVQKVNQTFPALAGAFSQFDEVSIYTYSSNVSRATDFTAVGKKLTEVLDQLKAVRGRNNGPAILGGPLAPQGPIVNGRPMDPNVPTVATPARESHVLNDAVLAAAMDLSRRDRSRRKIIFVVSDGREYRSDASYSDVLKVLLSNGILVYGVGTDEAAIPGYSKVSKLHLPGLGYSNILPKYANATGGEIFTEFSRDAIESAYSRAIGDARNLYTVGYATRATPSSTYRQIEVRIARPDLKVYAKDGYYPAPAPPTPH